MGLGTESKKTRFDKGLKGKELVAMIQIEPKYMSQIENDKATRVDGRLVPANL